MPTLRASGLNGIFHMISRQIGMWMILYVLARLIACKTCNCTNQFIHNIIGMPILRASGFNKIIYMISRQIWMRMILCKLARWIAACNRASQFIHNLIAIHILRESDFNEIILFLILRASDSERLQWNHFYFLYYERATASDFIFERATASDFNEIIFIFYTTSERQRAILYLSERQRATSMKSFLFFIDKFECE